MNENQKPVTEDYRKHWDEIFGKPLEKTEPIPFAGHVNTEETDNE